MQVGEPDDGYLVRTGTSAYRLRDDGIVMQVITRGGEQSIEDARENTRAFESLADERKRLLLVDMSVPYRTGPGVREYYASDEASRYVAALALLTRSRTTKIVGNFFLGLTRPPYPCRMFTEERQAVEWLHGQSQP